MRKAFTLIELLSVIAILAILVAILLPVFATSRSKSHQATCLSNVKNTAAAVLMYAEDYNAWPSVDAWSHWGASHTHMPCPDAKPLPKPDPAYPDYGLNAWLTDARDLTYMTRINLALPSTTVLVYDNPLDVFVSPDPQPKSDNPSDFGKEFNEVARKRHFFGANYAFVDGHARWYKPEDIVESRHLFMMGGDLYIDGGKGNDGVHPTFMPWPVGTQPGQ